MARKLTPEQREQMLAALAEDDASADDFEVEIWNERGQGARVPFSKGKSWLAEAFGIDLEPPKADAPKADQKTPADDGKVRPAHFGGQRRTAG